MADKRDLRVNDLSRYKKSSERLVLEDYSHCEVPAGCGGGILRWIDPSVSLPLKMWLWSTGDTITWLDGAPFKSARIDVRAGAHVLGIQLTPTEGRPPQVALALLYTDDITGSGVTGPTRSRSIGQKVKILSGAGADLFATSTGVDDGWNEVGFDQAGWRPMVPARPVMKRDRDWHLESAKEAGAQVVGAEGESGRIWIRCFFTLGLGGAP